MFKKDVVFLHAPSVYDFRKDTIMFGPISDVVPSSATFEMYPVGITSIADALEQTGFNVQIINLAYQMLRDPKYDVEKVISRLNPRMFAIDLHWLPHAHGSIEVAKIVKKYHPHTPVVFGGLSASYYHEELINYPWVDFVLRGDSTEEPMKQLVLAIRRGMPVNDIPNLTWKTPDGKVRVNPLTHVPDNMDYVSIPSYSYCVRSVFKYANLHNTVPYLKWLNYPITALLTSRGCTQNCSICGGSQAAYKKICNREKPAYRSPKTMVEDILFLQKLGRAPIFILNDFRMAGPAHTEEFLKLLKEADIKNELVFELFFPGDDNFFAKLADAVPKFSLEITLESHLERIRRFNGKFAVPNEVFENTVASAFKYGCRKIDIFFMTGIPKQSYHDAISCVDYCRELLDKFNADKRLCFFVAPLAPFLDPGCLAFENPEKYGYRQFYKTLEEHRQGLTMPSWKYILSYETDSMTRDEIVEATYEAALRLNELKKEYNLIEEQLYRQIDYRIRTARDIIREIDQIMTLSDEKEKKLKLNEIRVKVAQVNKGSLCGEDELTWPITERFASFFSLFKVLVSLFFKEWALFFNRIGFELKEWSYSRNQRMAMASNSKNDAAL
ncbi:TIGR04190 family B12-binding domain/radical SAM domain protein [Thermincola potens]|uniref:Radical SAM domain protein n=1 Tax=Thermincola potens (strain JR) TaxID=635013 RepID=D5X9Q5_THEPJ|nr:TIGR04190 family B12-binding domain/radical SAM domain protein [Thermincola potens]ADG81126.1 Radical SAM domain protein [Thermincola potens JR]